MASSVKPISARRKLELSQLNPSAVQKEAMGIDVELDKFVTFVNSQIRGDISELITQAEIVRTIEGASTLSVTVNDYNRELLRSSLLVEKVDVQIDGLWFRLAAVDKNDDEITMTFEDREIAILRTYDKWRIAQRGQMTRAEFVLSLIREVKEFQIPVVIPELHKIQPIEKYSGDPFGQDIITQKSRGIPKDINSTAKTAFNHRETNQNVGGPTLTVKGADATDTQIQNANIILQVGDSMGVSRRLKVVAIMVAITESRLINNPGGDADSAGIFQQRPNWGSYKDRTDVETSARMFYQAAIPVEKDHPDDPYWVIAADVQHPALQYQTRYSLWRTEADRFVNAYGDTGVPVTTANAMNDQTSSTGADGPFYFYRGNIVDRNGKQIRKPENTWDCFQRLADEVDWRAFFIAGTFYWISESDLFQQLPLATVTEFQDGIYSINGNYDNAKKTATIDLEVEVGRWDVPPGSVVVLKDMGPYNGRWLVNDFTRNLITTDRKATITLKKPRPKLPEPVGSNANGINTSWVPDVVIPTSPTNDLINKILANKSITFSNTSESNDVALGQIDPRVLQFLLWITAKGFPVTITALKSDHSETTTAGNVSAHAFGKAVDLGNFNSSNPQTEQVMRLIGNNQAQLGFSQLIGPYSLLCKPLGYYDLQTLREHKSHIHVGWPI